MKNYEYVLRSPRTFEKRSLKKSQPKPDEVMVEPVLAGICGSDLYHYSLFKEGELRLGHEWIGKVTQTGSEVKSVSAGDYITTSAAIGCGKCEECLNMQVNLCLQAQYLGSDTLGILRGHLNLHERDVIKLTSNHQSEVLIEVVAVAAQAIKLMKQNLKSKPEKVLILGAGTVGLFTAMLLTHEKIDFFIAEIKKSRVQRAKDLGFKALLLPMLLMDSSASSSFDVIFDATTDRDGNAGGYNYLPVFGKKNLLAIIIGKYARKVEMEPDHFGRLSARLVFMRGVALDTLKETVNQWSGKLQAIGEKIITHTYRSDQLDEAFAMAMDTAQSGKVIIELE